jgi:DNA-binding response OmpR family regulator
MSSRILLIEDEPGLVLTVTDLLAAEGFAVESATDGPSGLKRALEGNFDLIVLDVMLPARTASTSAGSCASRAAMSPC